MSRTALLSLSLLLAAGVAFAQPAPNPAHPPVTKSSTLKFTGKVVKVDATGNAITLEARKDTEKTFTIPADAKVLYNGKPAKLADFQAGDHATVAYTGSADNPTVKAIAGRSPGKPKAPKTK